MSSMGPSAGPGPGPDLAGAPPAPGQPAPEPRSGRYDRPIFGQRAPAPSPRRTARDSAGPAGGEPPGRPRTRRRLSLQGQFLLFSLLVLTAVAVAAFMYLRPAQAVYVLDVYQYTHVGTRDFRDLIVTTGTVAPETVEIARSPLAARVQAIHVDVGDDVEPGAVLVELVSESLLDNVAKARHEAEAAAIELEQARLKADGDVMTKEQEVQVAERRLIDAEERLPHVEELYRLGGVSAMELQEARDDVERRRRELSNAVQALLLARRQAELSVRQAEQKAQSTQRELERLLDQLDEMTVRASAGGRILDISVREGQRVDAGTELLRHADVARQHVETAVTPDQAARLEEGTPALLRVGGRTVPAVTAFVAPQAKVGASGSSVAVTLALDPEASASLRPYTDVAVELELGVRRSRPALPRGPFFASGDTSFVYVISADGRSAERRDVRYGAVDGNSVEILGGLEPGERIVYSSYTAFRTHPVIELIPEGGRLVE